MDFVVLTNMVWKALGSSWHEARIICLTEMLRGILTSQSINTSRLAARMGGRVQFESHAQRIRRFLAEQNFDWIVMGRLMLRIAGVAGQKKFVVAVDRTNWDFGKTAINFLVISVVVCGIGVPVVWTQLGKKGNSKTGERLELLERFLKIVPASQITVFLADREFIGKTWFKALQKRRIPYAIRVRNNQFVTLTDGKRIKIFALAKELTNQKPRQWNNVDLDGVPCALSLKRLKEKDLLAVVSFGLKSSEDPLETYRQRWAIELCFACLKTKGFDIESTPLRHTDRLEKMFAIASMAAAAALAASKNENKLQTGSRKNPTRKKTMATPPVPSSSAA
jgi:Transposase DDE domain